MGFNSPALRVFPKLPRKSKTLPPAEDPHNQEQRKSRDIAKRWTPDLIADGFTPISDFFLKNYYRLSPPIKATEAMFIIQLMSHKWDHSAPFPSFSTIAKRMGVTTAAARGYARNLEKSGYLTRVSRVGQTNRFLVEPLFKALEKLRSQIIATEERDRQRKQAES